MAGADHCLSGNGWVTNRMAGREGSLQLYKFKSQVRGSFLCFIVIYVIEK